MTVSSLLDEPQAGPTVPPRVQAARVFVLARLLTAVTAVVSGITVIVIRGGERVVHGQCPFDQDLLDWKLWPLVFLFWLGVFTAARRYLRLDVRP